MASVTQLGAGTFTTTSGTKTLAVTPAVGDQIIIVAAHTGNVTVTAPTDTASGTYTLINSAVKLTSADWLGVWIRNQLIASAVSTTFSTAPGTTTGGGLFVLKASGLAGVGNAGVRQSAKQDNAAAAATPTTTFSSAPLGSAPVIDVNFNGSNPHGVTVPTGFPANIANAAYSSPTAGLKLASLDSGETRTAIPWGSTSATESCTIAVELLVASGSLAATEASDTLSSVSAISISGSLSKTEASDTLSSASVVPIVGSLAATEATDTLAAASGISLSGSLAAAEESDALSGTSSVAIGASLAATEAADSLSATAALAIKAALAATEAADSVSATGLGNPPVEAALSGIEADDGLAATAVLPIVGSVAITEDDDRVAGIFRRHSRRTINPHTRDIQSRPLQQSDARPTQDNYARPAQHNVSRPRSISRGTR